MPCPRPWRRRRRRCRSWSWRCPRRRRARPWRGPAPSPRRPARGDRTRQEVTSPAEPLRAESPRAVPPPPPFQLVVVPPSTAPGVQRGPLQLPPPPPRMVPPSGGCWGGGRYLRVLGLYPHTRTDPRGNGAPCCGTRGGPRRRHRPRLRLSAAPWFVNALRIGFGCASAGPWGCPRPEPLRSAERCGRAAV